MDPVVPGSSPGPGPLKNVRGTGKNFSPLNIFSEKDNNVGLKVAVNMEKWRSIDYEKELKRELKRIDKSSISETNKKLIIRYKNYRLANGISVARVCREIKSLRLLCERCNLNLSELNEDILDELLAELELSNQSLNTINEYKNEYKKI